MAGNGIERRRKKGDEGLPPQAWLTTYGDLMSLLLTFFVLLMTFSSIEMTKFKRAMGSLQGALGILRTDQGLLFSIIDLRAAAYDEMRKKVEEFDLYLIEHKLKDVISIEMKKEGIHISISSPILFDLGQADLKPSIIPLLSKTAEIIRKFPDNSVRVEGHTDNLPINTPQFQSNWELSTARALSVVKYFIQAEGISPTRLMAVGYGEYRPIVPNDTPENLAKNRRVEIFINYPNEN